MLRHKSVILAGTVLALQVLLAYQPYFLRNPGFTASSEYWWTAFENRSFPVGRGTDEWTSDHNGSCHLTVSGNPCIVAIKQAIGTVVFPGDTIWMRCSKTDMSGFGDLILNVGGADAPFEQQVFAPAQAGDFDVSLVSKYFLPVGTEIHVHLIVYPGDGQVWIDSIWLGRDTSQTGPVSVREDHMGQLPTRPPMVGRAYPSPTTGPVSMAYNLSRPARTEVSIFDLSGSLVRRLESPGAVGANHAVWNGTDEQGRGVAAGVYYYSVKAEDAPITSGKITLTR
jgi:hypothetical protein